MEPQIIYQDENLLVIDKPSGITVNKSDTTSGEITIQDWVENSIFQNQLPGSPDTDFYKRAGIVHRLDKETSGVLLAAKSEDAFRRLQQQFKDRTVKKEYVTLVHGKVVPQEGEIHVPVGRLPWNRKRFGIISGGRDSVTNYSVSDYYTDREGDLYSLLDVMPQTGRTHQIRVHMKYLGYPVVSDELYAGRKTASKDRKNLSRTFLHAARISIEHPVSGERLQFESQLPLDLQKFVSDFLQKV